MPPDREFVVIGCDLIRLSSIDAIRHDPEPGLIVILVRGELLEYDRDEDAGGYRAAMHLMDDLKARDRT